MGYAYERIGPTAFSRRRGRLEKPAGRRLSIAVGTLVVHDFRHLEHVETRATYQQDRNMLQRRH